MAFSRDRLTWIAYGLLAWFAYLQAAPGLVVPHLRDELHLSYSTGGLHIAAFAAGSVVAGLIRRRDRARDRAARAVLGLGGGDGAWVRSGSRRVARRRRRSARCWSWASRGGLLLVTIQALLADHHGEQRAIALTEANVAASVAYVVLIGALSLAAATGAGLARGAARLARRCRCWRCVAQPAAADRGAAGRGGRARRGAAGRVLGRRGDALLHHRGGVVHHRLGRELRRGRRGRLRRRGGLADDRLLRRRGRRARGRQRARPPPRAAPAAGDRAGHHRGRVRGPLAGVVVRCRRWSGSRCSASASATCSRSGSRSPSRWRRIARSWRAAARSS